MANLRHKLKRFLFHFVLVCLIIGICEGLARSAAPLLEREVLPGFTYWTDNLERYKDRIVEYQSIPYVYEPYSLWIPKEYHGRYVNIESDGFRRTIHVTSTASKKIRIAFFGGSTMQGLGSDDAHTIPSLVERRLADLVPDVDTECVNMGINSYQSSQELILFWRKIFLQETHFDIVVFYDGANEVWMSRERRAAGDHNYFSEIARNIGLRGGQERLDFQVARLLNRVMRELAGQDKIKLIRYLARLAPPITLEPAQANALKDDVVYAQEIANVYYGNMQAIKALAAVKGIRPLFVLQPVAAVTRPTPQILVEHPELDLAGNIFRLVYAMAPMVRDKEFVDLSRVLDGYGDVYFDWCHITEEGNAIVANALAEILAQQIVSISAN
jgi:lysophospholipase L1-like esterase